jgi:hypothetical protein
VKKSKGFISMGVAFALIAAALAGHPRARQEIVPIPQAPVSPGPVVKGAVNITTAADPCVTASITRWDCSSGE